ncbi:MAG: dihydroorotate dehydrogenase electron transfer subunit [Dehalococcoidia bacterium]
MKQSSSTVRSNLELMPGVQLMWIEAPDIAAVVQPGQFVTVRCGDFTLRRPFSVHQVSSHEIALLLKVTGKGSLWLSQRQTGDKIDVLGPLGKGFTLGPKSKNLLLVAGGVGTAPLVFLMQRASSRYQITLLHGTSTAAQVYAFSSAGKKRSTLAALPKGVRFIPVTEDGSMGRRGRATDVLPEFLDWADQVYACGPVDMYKAMAAMSFQAKQDNLKLKECQVSLEVRMGCGFGACYGCTINTRKGPRQVCRDGPVFELDDIIWQEVKI